MYQQNAPFFKILPGSNSETCLNFFFFIKISVTLFLFVPSIFARNDEKTAADYKIQGGSVLHLVLALRGGGRQHLLCQNFWPTLTNWYDTFKKKKKPQHRLKQLHMVTLKATQRFGVHLFTACNVFPVKTFPHCKAARL